jgi:REase_DpnII-MboI
MSLKVVQVDKDNIAESIKSIYSLLSKAENYFMQSEYRDPSVFNEDGLLAEYYMEKAFISVLVFLEVNSLNNTYKEVNRLFIEAKKNGLLQVERGIEDYYLAWGDKLRYYLDAIAISFNVDSGEKLVSNDILKILRATQYYITDGKLFGKPPKTEQEVHERIEGVLRCYFPNVKTKPSLTKPIKNFEPDTGLPSIRTLIEYKYVENKSKAKIIADQILADTRGYISRNWDNFVYVIYEASRIKPESEWKQLIKECGVDNTEVVVICGEPKGKEKKKPKKK